MIYLNALLETNFHILLHDTINNVIKKEEDDEKGEKTKNESDLVINYDRSAF